MEVLCVFYSAAMRERHNARNAKSKMAMLKRKNNKYIFIYKYI